MAAPQLELRLAIRCEESVSVWSLSSARVSTRPFAAVQHAAGIAWKRPLADAAHAALLGSGDLAAYVHVNLRVKDHARQAALAPRFRAALEAAGGRILHFGPVAQTLEGDVTPLPMAGIFEFATLADALAFYQSMEYAPLKAEREAAQEAQMFVVDAG